MTYKVIFSPEARGDLIELYDYIADHASPETALTYLTRIEACCLDLTTFPERGTPRDDLAPGLRTMGFERRVTIAFQVAPAAVTVIRILYGGRDLDGAFDEGD